MPVYVDDMRAKYRGMIMCHMADDTSAELLAMVEQIGFQRKWIQAAGTYREHFDVCLTLRAKAVRAGAIEVTGKELIKRMMAKRNVELFSALTTDH